MATALALTGQAAPAMAHPVPPPIAVPPPAGEPPESTPGLRAPSRCTPPEADPEPAADPIATRLRLPELHRLATGRGQLVAVIDTGVYPHPLLGDRVRGAGDYLTGGDGLDDCDGHGTAVAGLLAAAAEPGSRGRAATPIGIAPRARLLAIRQSSPSFEVPGPGGTTRPAGDTRTLAESVVLAVRKGADVVNISEAVCLSAAQAATAGADLQAALSFAARSDVVVVAAAGNVGSGSCVEPGAGQVSLPGWYDDQLLAVGAVGPDDAPASFTVPGPWVDVAAPGTGLRSLAVGGGTTSTGVEGTSFAAPWVSGLAALVRERYPELTARQVTDRILATARPPARGRDDRVGHGVIDPVAALTAVPAVLHPAPEPAAAVTVVAELPGTAPRPAAPSSGPPVDLVAAGLLLLAGAAAAVLLRRRPRRMR
ncbi:type VII secretion-associated serine protease mycosin [Pseudonocardia xinjiangensis]|uniref:Type VII secretion-associated serine protease mycosin n=1 Tax=Pseudonocardia xinjiangensis TaxID=75289 RepID=A0ABX1R6R8_9PSEU|nr:type VII secretion-associated serine protease mycosin [Pseudonocardia xinjiangensis]NMH76098.1 type VII secretion-associated serine protease mycosin [Pseudonocardia xinjiangensis]